MLSKKLEKNYKRRKPSINEIKPEKKREKRRRKPSVREIKAEKKREKRRSRKRFTTRRRGNGKWKTS